MKWEHNDYRPEGFECWSADWGKYYQLSVTQIGEKRYTVRWYHRGITDIKEHINAENWDEAKAAAIALVKRFFAQRAEYWRDMKIGFTNWVEEE